MKLLDWLFGGLAFERVEVERDVIDTIIELAQSAHPKEFIAFLQGRVSRRVLKISGVFYQQYYASTHSALPIINIPIASRDVGSVHSHPGGSNRPSSADLGFYSKHGILHIIISTPYSKGSIACYDKNGRELDFDVV